MGDILFIGDCGDFRNTSNGVYAKNLQLFARLKVLCPSLRHVNTSRWKRNPFILINVLWSLWLYRKKNVLLSLNTMSAHKVLRVINIFFPQLRVNYFVIGGILPDYIQKCPEATRKCYGSVKWFMVESRAMKEKLTAMGYTNVIHTPNFKKISFIPEKPMTACGSGPMKFVLLSRIIPEKGCDLIFDAVKAIQEKRGEESVCVDFYGKIDQQYKSAFMEKVQGLRNVAYKGFLMLGDTKNYSTLAQYDAMLFPTFWKGEGFPGVLIDAMIAGTPVIASDWGYNTEIISDGETGLIVPNHDSQALAAAMLYMMDHRELVAKMAKACQRSCMSYDTDNVLTKDFFNKILK